MKWLLLGAAAALALFSTQAGATLMLSANINGTTITCSDQQASSASCPGGDTNPAVGQLGVQNQTVSGVQFIGSSQTSQHGPPTNSLNSSSFQFINNNAGTVNLQLAVGDTSYASPTATFSASGSGTFQSAVGSSVLMQYFADTANGQPATTPTTLPGTALASPADTHSATLVTDSFAFNHNGAFVASAPFSMALETTISLVSGGSVVGRNQAIVTEVVGVPEPSSLALIGSALLLTGWVARRRRS